MVSCGRNLILEDRVFISGISENGVRMGDNVSIGKNSLLFGSAVIQQKGVGITIGNNVGINANCYLGGQGGIVIENDVIIGPGVKIFSENHIYNELGLIRKQGVTRKETIIKNNCWIGAGVIVLCGVTIHEGCVIAAGSVVTKDIPSNSVAAGVPAKVVKNR
jgi:acetyltransferase-like isoleucine patch superfamily enzyme